MLKDLCSRATNKLNRQRQKENDGPITTKYLNQKNFFKESDEIYPMHARNLNRKPYDSDFIQESPLRKYTKSIHQYRDQIRNMHMYLHDLEKKRFSP